MFIKYFTPRKLELASKISEIDTRISPTDASIVACAVEDNVMNLVTIDDKLIHNNVIERNFRIKISHPKELI